MLLVEFIFDTLFSVCDFCLSKHIRAFASFVSFLVLASAGAFFAVLLFDNSKSPAPVLQRSVVSHQFRENLDIPDLNEHGSLFHDENFSADSVQDVSLKTNQENQSALTPARHQFLQKPTPAYSEAVPPLHSIAPETTGINYSLSPVDFSDDSILGKPMATEEQCVSFLLKNNPNPKLTVSPKELVSYYYEEGAREGIRPDVAFAQAILETGYFRYEGVCLPEQNNFCGLGATGPTVEGGYFPSAQLGVRAHIQHLLAYASLEQPSVPIIDPRYSIVRNAYGNQTFTRWSDLNGKWAVPGPEYGQKILYLFHQILDES